MPSYTITVANDVIGHREPIAIDYAANVRDACGLARVLYGEMFGWDGVSYVVATHRLPEPVLGYDNA